MQASFKLLSAQVCAGAQRDGLTLLSSRNKKPQNYGETSFRGVRVKKLANPVHSENSVDPVQIEPSTLARRPAELRSPWSFA